MHRNLGWLIGGFVAAFILVSAPRADDPDISTAGDAVAASLAQNQLLLSKLATFMLMGYALGEVRESELQPALNEFALELSTTGATAQDIAESDPQLAAGVTKFLDTIATRIDASTTWPSDKPANVYRSLARVELTMWREAAAALQPGEDPIDVLRRADRTLALTVGISGPLPPEHDHFARRDDLVAEALALIKLAPVTRPEGAENGTAGTTGAAGDGTTPVDEGDFPGYVVEGFDRPGGDYRVFDMADGDPTQCMAVCWDEAEQCKAFAYTPNSMSSTTPQCHLKSSVPDQVPCTGCYSGVGPGADTGPNPPDLRAILEDGVDRPGEDYANFDLNEADPEVCAAACYADSANCHAFTYVKPGVQSEHARCWLKSEVQPPMANDCCVSGLGPAAGAVVTRP